MGGGVALGYENLNDHDAPRLDPVLALLAGKLGPRREDCAPWAGKSTLNPLPLGPPEPIRHHLSQGLSSRLTRGSPIMRLRWTHF
jgi:hypothetical protein